MRGILLAINQLYAALREIRHGAGKGDFGCVVLAAEHGFAVKHLPQLHAVKAAGQLKAACTVGIPAFDRMGFALPVQLRVGGDEICANPVPPCPFLGAAAQWVITSSNA